MRFCCGLSRGGVAGIQALGAGSAVLASPRCCTVLTGREEEGGLSENVASNLAHVDFVDAAEPGPGVVEIESSGSLADRRFVGPFDLHERWQARPSVEVEDDLSQAPLLLNLLPKVLVFSFAINPSRAS